MANPFSEGNDTGPGGQYMDPSTGNNEWYLRPPQNGGPVQPYTGVDVIGGLNNFQDPTSVGSTPFSWENHASLNGSKSLSPSSKPPFRFHSSPIVQYSPFNAGVHNLPSRFATIPPPTVPAPPPAPTLCKSNPPFEGDVSITHQSGQRGHIAPPLYTLFPLPPRQIPSHSKIPSRTTQLTWVPTGRDRPLSPSPEYCHTYHQRSLTRVDVSKPSLLSRNRH